MKLVRSWPVNVPTGRSYVVDDAPRMLNENYSYAGLVDVDDDVIQLDWDTAVSREDLQHFAQWARMAPAEVHVAPVKVYPDSRRGLTRTIWNLRTYEGEGLRETREWEPTCDLFGFGMVYLPGHMIREFSATFADELAAGTVRWDDTGFAGWHHRTHGPANVAWNVRPIHLHYRISEVL